MPTVELTSYSTNTPKEEADCLLLFNYKSKAALLKTSRVDLPQLLSYASYHLA